MASIVNDPTYPQIKEYVLEHIGDVYPTFFQNFCHIVTRIRLELSKHSFPTSISKAPFLV